MEWNDVLHEMAVLSCTDAPVEVFGVEYDSRRVGRGDLFVAMRGGVADGNRHIDAAVAQGAVAVMTDSREAYERVRLDHRGIAVALVEHGRRALAEAGSAVLGHPQHKLALSGVTGTNGKTTTAFLLEAMLRSVGRTCVLIGTIETHVGNEVRVSPHTTPEASDTLRVFADGVKLGATEAVMEMSSHALEQERVWGLPVDVAMFTNLTQDHLDFHGTMERYFQSKVKLFEGVGALPPRVAVINGDDSYGSRLARDLRGPQLMTYGMTPGVAEYRAEDVALHAGETRFVFKTPQGEATMQSPLTGRVNVYNLLAASCAALARGLTLEEVAAAAEGLGQGPGGFGVVPGS